MTVNLPSISPAIQPSAHRAPSHDRTAAAIHSPRYTGRPSPQSSSSTSERRVGRDSSFAPTSAYTDQTVATQISPIDPSLSQKPFGYQQPKSHHHHHHQQPAHYLPPLVHQESLRPGADRSSDVHTTRPSLPAFGSLSGYPSAASQYQYTSHPSTSTGHNFSTRDAPVEGQKFAYSYPSPQRSQQTHPLQPPFSYDPAPGSSYSFDRQTSPPEERRALPSMPGLSDPLPPPATSGAPHSMTSPAHSLERYRFDANAANDHPARRRRGNLPKEATARLNEWFAQHANYPYPKEEEKQRLQEQTGLSMSQVSSF